MIAVLFSTPIFATATIAGAAAVPVIIHLLNRRRYRIVDWAAMRFLLAAQRQNVRRLRLEQWLLLAVRCLILVLAAVAMASVTPWAEALWRHLLPGGAMTGVAVSGRTHKVIVIDGSMSMTLQGEGGSSFDRARALAAELVRSSPSGDGFSVLLMGSPVQAVVPGPADDPARVVREIDGLRCPHSTGDLPGTLPLIEELMRRAPGKFAQREVYFLTDLQRGTWTPPTSPGGAWTEPWSRLQAQSQLIVVDVGRDGVENLAVTGLTLGDPLAIAGARTHLSVAVQNFSPVERKSVKVELLAGSGGAAPAVVQQESIGIPAWGSAAVTFPYQFRAAGDIVFQARVEGDSLQADDIRSLTVSVRDTLPVLVVNGKPAVERREQASSWLADALNPFAAGQQHSAYPARPRTIDFAQFADPTAGDLVGYDAVFLCDVPRLTERGVARLETHLQRGGGLVISLGPDVDLENYNRLLFRDGLGLLPGKLTGVIRAAKDQYFTLTAEGEAFGRPPLAAFADDNDRAALLSARFQQYVRVESTGRKLLTIGGGDPLVLERSRHRGRVVLIASTLNTDWTSWPIAPSFPPFVQELLRYVVPPGPRRTVSAGEPLEELLPASVLPGEALVQTPDGRSTAISLTADSLATRFRFDETDQSGLYRVSFGSPRRDLLWAVNPPVGGSVGAESDLRRLSPAELQALTPDEDVQIVDRLAAIRHIPKRLATATSVETAPATAHGPAIARIVLLALFALLIVEVILAWRFGSARSGGGIQRDPPSSRLRLLADRVSQGVAVGLMLVCVLGGGILLHAAWTDDVLSFLSPDLRSRIEGQFGVPPATPGEGTRWRLEFLPFLTGKPVTDRWLAGSIGFAAIVLAIIVLRKELPRARRTASAWWPLVGLRPLMIGLVLALLLPQVSLLFEREGWPDLVVMIDDSRSMGHVDDYQDPAVKAKAGELAGDAPRRLALVQSLLTRRNAEWLEALRAGRQTKVHVFHFSERAEQIADAETPGSAAIAALNATGPSSRLGAAVGSVLQEYRGSSLAGIVLFSDGITTDGDDLIAAAQQAARAGVPLYSVGIGDAHEPRDLILHDLQVDDSVHVQDRLVFEARLTARGGLRATSVPVSLMEKVGDQWKELKRETVALDPAGKPSRVRLTHAPSQSGERTYALVVPAQPDESDPTNNRLERSVFVAEAQRTRVLYIEGYPRYEYRFLKVLLERETQEVRGNKSIDLTTLLTDADPDYAKQDRTAIDALPASREELFRHFDLIVLGDVDPRHPKLGEKHLQWLADFVKEKGGGLLAIAGPQYMPYAYRDTPLADCLPVEVPSGASGDGGDRIVPYRPRLTPIGQMHALFRLTPDEADNVAIWDRLMPLYWSAGPLKPKPAAEVLATRPAGAANGAEPLAVQQFVGAGRVLYFGFDESWRWRRREDERLYNQFWLQTIRYVARTRLGRYDLRLDRQTPYRHGEPIRVTVRFPDDVPPPGPDTAVQVAVEAVAPNGEIEVQTLKLARIEGNRAAYDALVPRTTEGVWRFRLASPAQPGPSPQAEARVLPPPGELDRLRMNRTDMERAALVSRGRFFTLADVERLPQELPDLPRVTLHQPRPPYRIWNHPVVFGLLLGLASCEWLLRKRRHLL